MQAPSLLIPGSYQKAIAVNLETAKHLEVKSITLSTNLEKPSPTNGKLLQSQKQRGFHFCILFMAFL
jgi:hypothetical protein